jgi:NTP pyrophosphatase (non-canonical NTP hydrolase)
LGGETGEVLEAIKKLARMMRGMKGGVKDAAEAKKAIEEEIGDVLISLDRVAEFFDIDIEEATKKKFNKTSKQKGLTIRFQLDNKPKRK